jgi:hypothetical protein
MVTFETPWYHLLSPEVNLCLHLSNKDSAHDHFVLTKIHKHYYYCCCYCCYYHHQQQQHEQGSIQTKFTHCPRTHRCHNQSQWTDLITKSNTSLQLCEVNFLKMMQYCQVMYIITGLQHIISNNNSLYQACVCLSVSVLLPYSSDLTAVVAVRVMCMETSLAKSSIHPSVMELYFPL